MLLNVLVEHAPQQPIGAIPATTLLNGAATGDPIDDNGKIVLPPLTPASTFIVTFQEKVSQSASSTATPIVLSTSYLSFTGGYPRAQDTATIRIVANRICSSSPQPTPQILGAATSTVSVSVPQVLGVFDIKTGASHELPFTLFVFGSISGFALYEKRKWISSIPAFLNKHSSASKYFRIS